MAYMGRAFVDSKWGQVAVVPSDSMGLGVVNDEVSAFLPEVVLGGHGVHLGGVCVSELVCGGLSAWRVGSVLLGGGIMIVH